MKNKIETIKAINAFREDSDNGIQTRKEYMKGRDVELKTKKSNHLAQWFDELGNCIVLTRDLRRLQLIGNECNWK